MTTYFQERFEKFSVAAKTPIAPFPKNSLIEVTNACNHACVFCHNPFMHRKAGILDESVFERFVTEACELGLEEVGLYSTGEPFLVKSLERFVAIAKQAGARRIYVTTNGAMASLERVQLAVANGLSSIKFSINAGTRESYAMIHGRDEFELVLENVRKIDAWRKASGAQLQMLGSFIYTSATKHEIDAHRATFSPYLEDVMYLEAKSQGGRTEGNIQGIVDTHPEHPDLADVAPCEMLWNRLHLTCEGYLTACCVDYEHDLTYADFSQAGGSLKELWNSEKIADLRRRHIEKRFEGTICSNCLLGGKEPYEPISDLRGRFGRKGKYQDDTMARIKQAEDLVRTRRGNEPA